ncbi:MAG: cytochrome P450, partial [Actinomycetota bacterium]|nr:cytochrome P450 [Actinomycetota bacterium]
MASDVALGTFDLSDPEFWIAPRSHRNAAFRALRAADELVYFDEWEFEGSPLPRGPGYWAVTRYDDVWAASRNPQVFISGRGVNIGDIPQEMNEFIGSMIAMDDPRHFRLRNIVAKGFTPKQITQVEGYVRTKATVIIDRLLEQFPDGECDFVEQVAAPLPLQIICEMMGIPPSDEAQVFQWTNVILGVGDPEYVGSFEQLMGVLMQMFMYAQALGEDRRANPGDDIASVLMHAEVDGERLTPQEFGSFFILLVVAGNETTRNAIAHGMKLLTDFPDQRRLWFENYEAHAKTAVDEIVRCSTPVIHFRRTAIEDIVVNNTKIGAGQKVVLWYNSANRDETVFANADDFE